MRRIVMTKAEQIIDELASKKVTVTDKDDGQVTDQMLADVMEQAGYDLMPKEDGVSIVDTDLQSDDDNTFYTNVDEALQACIETLNFSDRYNTYSAI